MYQEISCRIFDAHVRVTPRPGCWVDQFPTGVWISFPPARSRDRSRHGASGPAASGANTRELQGRAILPGMLTDAELRKAARARAEVRVFRAGEQEAAADADALYWDRIPIDERAQFVWTLSLEMHALAHPDQPYDSRLSRSVARITGR